MYNPRKTEDLLKFIPQDEHKNPETPEGLYEQLTKNYKPGEYTFLSLKVFSEAINEMFNKKDQNGRDSISG